MTDGHVGPFDATSTLGWTLPIAAVLSFVGIPAFAVWVVMTRQLGSPTPEVVERVAGMFALVGATIVGSLALSTRLSPVLKALSALALGAAAALLVWKFAIL